MRAPNVILVMADDLGYGELGSYGQRLIATPRLDRMAAEGVRFTQFYAGSTVCAPSRAVLMTGRHTGHVRVRGNADRQLQQLSTSDTTVAQLFKQKGYATALIGKWGLGEDDSPGHPLEKGFDHFFGYLNQTHAHNYYPEFLWRDRARVPLRNVVVPSPETYGEFVGGTASTRVDYTPDLFADAALGWIDENRARPFFLYLALTAPHANNEATKMTGDGQEVPDYGIYAERSWPTAAKGQAALVTRLDRDLGRILDALETLGIAERTLVLFTSDNGPHAEGGFDAEFFAPAGRLRGMKRDLYEGGIRVPLIAYWKGRTKAGTVCEHPAYLGDVMATVAELLDLPAPAGADSVSILPSVLGRPSAQAQHDYLYWEFYEQGGAQALRFGKYKAVRHGLGEGTIELYDLERDPGEAHDLAPQSPELVARAAALMNEAHVPDPSWKPRGSRRAPPPPRTPVAGR